MAIEATRTIGDIDPEAENEGCALVEHSANEVERCHRVLRWMLDEYPYDSSRCLMSKPTEGYPRVGRL
jgi:hypothetical protein